MVPSRSRAGELGDVSVLGVYMVDPNINVLDPNNSSGTGGALVVDLDTSPERHGRTFPQTDTTTRCIQRQLRLWNVANRFN